MSDPQIRLDEMRAGFATLMLHRHVAPIQLADAIGVELPTRPGCSHTAGLTVLATGPATWLAVCDEAAPEWVQGLQESCRGIASVSDQSGGLVAWRLSGSGARTLLQRGAFVDLHPQSFGAGDAVTTSIAHIGVTIWQIKGSPSFHLAVFRSYAHSFTEWIDAHA